MNHNLFIDLFIVMCADNEAFNHGYCYQFCGELQCALEHIFNFFQCNGEICTFFS